MSIYKYKSIPANFKSVDFTGRRVEGYFSTFDVLDSDGDIGRKGMFLKSIEENGPKSRHPRIKYFLNHDPFQVPGVIQELEEDSTGLRYVAQVGTHDLGVDYMKMVESGIITEHSYGYRPDQSRKTSAGNELIRVALMEGSGLTAWGANQFTPITAYGKAESAAEVVEKTRKRIAIIEKFCRNTTATDETIELLLLEIKQLNQLVVDMSSTTQTVDKTPEPGTHETDFSGIIKTLNNIHNTFKSI